MYATFSRREAAVGMLEVRAGSPPSAIELLDRYQRIEWIGRLPALWTAWEAWFNELEETHTSLPTLVFFRSPQPDRSASPARSSTRRVSGSPRRDCR